MHRKYIRALVGASDVDIPTGTFTANRFLYYNGISIITLVAVQGPASATDNAIARFDGTTGALIQNSTVTIDDAGNIAGAGTINGVDPNLYAIGVAVAGADSALTLWDNVGGIDGRQLKYSTVIINEVATGAGTAVSGNLVRFSSAGPTSYLLRDTGIAYQNVVSTTSNPSIDNRVARYDGTTGVLIQQSTVSIDDAGNITGVTSINGVAPGTWVVGPASSVDKRVAYFSGTTGKLLAQTNYEIKNVVVVATGDHGAFGTIPQMLGTQNDSGTGMQSSGVLFSDLVFRNGTYVIGNLPRFANSGSSTFLLQDSGIASANVVTNAGSSTDNAVARFDGVTGKIIQNSVVIISDLGVVTGITAINGIDPATWVVGPSSATDNAVARFNLTTGKLIQDSLVIVDDSGNVTGLGTLNTRTIARWVDGPAAGGSTDNTLAVWDGTSGRLLKNGSAAANISVDQTTGLITTPVGVLLHSTSAVTHTDNAVARFDGTGYKQQDSAVIIDDSGNVTGMGTLNTRTIANWVESTSAFPTAGRILVVAADGTRQIQPTGVTVSDFVVGPNSATDNAVVRFDNTTGKLVQNSAVTIADSTGNIAGAGTYNTYRLGQIIQRIVGGSNPRSYVFTASGAVNDWNIRFDIPYTVGSTSNLTVSLLASSGFNQGHVMCGPLGGAITSNGGVVALATTGSPSIPGSGFISVLTSLTAFTAGATLTCTLSGTSHSFGTAQIHAFAT